MRLTGRRRRTLLRPPRAFRRSRFSRFHLVLLAILASIFAFLGFFAQSSGLMQWALALASLGVLAAFAGRLVFRGALEPAPLMPPAEENRYTAGELARVAASVRRAARGLRYSQVLVTSRARAAFLDQARLALGFDAGTMQTLQRDRRALRRLFGDELADFLHVRTGDLDDRFEWAFQARGRRGFAVEFGDILERMEAWR